MLDPLTALGLAGNVIQIADVTWKLVAGAHELHTSGSLSALTTIKTDAETVCDQAQGIRTLLQPTIGCLTRDETSLYSLSSQIESTSIDLLGYVTLDAQQVSVWNSIKGAAKTIRNKRKIIDLASRLDRLQGQLGLQILVALRRSLSEQSTELHDQYDSIHGDVRHIIQVLEDTRTKGHKIDTDVDASQSLAQSFAASTASNGWTQDSPGDASQQVTSQELNSQLVSAKSEYGKNHAILRLLRYRHMQDRRDEIETAHQKTFEWVFQANNEATPFANFLHWLGADNTTLPYWINGKAGSGKSTLMKFIAGDARTRGALSGWAGSEEITTASCFFWNLGTVMQKSHQGLLQSLLYTVLDKHPRTIPLVFADIWDSLRDRGTIEDMPPLTLVEVKRAFSILSTLELPFKMCFFVDGIDEYDGDHVDICSFLKSTCSDRIKLVLSSRPINACVEAFRHCPTLRLEDLTYSDIKEFVDDRLARHEKMKHLIKTQPLEAPILVEELIAKASGVFLWVRLVVKSLLDGLCNDDRVSDLQARLRLIPPDLESLYSHMLGKMSPLYREQAAEMFQIVRYARDVWVDRPLQTLLLSYAEPDSQVCLQLPLGPLAAAEALQRCRAMENRLRSRCCGLLETRYTAQSFGADLNKTSLNDELVKDWRDAPKFVLKDSEYLTADDRDAINSNVQYLHRTVAEYIHRKDIWPRLTTREVDRPPISAATAVAHATLVKMKIVLMGQGNSMTWARYLLRCCCDVEAETNKAKVEILDELNRVMHHHWEGGRGWGRNHWADPDDCDIRYHHMFALAVRAGLCKYVEAKLLSLGPDLIRCGGIPLLRQIIPDGLSSLKRAEFNEVPCMASLLFRYGADPNEMYKDVSSWQFVMDAYSKQVKPSNANAWTNLLGLFITNGADVNATIYSLSTGASGQSQLRSRRYSMSPLQAVRQVSRLYALCAGTTAATSELEDLLLERGAQLHVDRVQVDAATTETDEPVTLFRYEDDGEVGEVSETNTTAATEDHLPIWMRASQIYNDEAATRRFQASERANLQDSVTDSSLLADSSRLQRAKQGIQDAARLYLPSVPDIRSVVPLPDVGLKDLRYHMGQGDKTPRWHYMAQGYLPKSVRWLH